MVEYGLANRDLSGIRMIGIDEICRKKGHVYPTDVYDLESKSLIWSGEGLAKDTLRQFFNFLGQEKTAQIKGVYCDMWNYSDVIRQIRAKLNIKSNIDFYSILLAAPSFLI